MRAKATARPFPSRGKEREKMYEFKGSPETLVFVFGVCTSFNGTSTAHFLAIFEAVSALPFPIPRT